MTPTLQVLIPTIVSRAEQFTRLTDYLFNIIAGYPVEIIKMCDNKELSIGAKRQALLDSCAAPYFVMIDDDDSVSPWYFDEVFSVFGEHTPDCITYKESVRIDGREYTCNHALGYNEWKEKFDGYDHVRTPYYKDVLRTSIAKQVGFNDLRYGEDHDFARRIKPLLKTEHHIDRIMYYYFGKSLSPQEHNKRYGIR